ncbi:hypothetical protein ACTXL8_17750 [Glutamicibacter arilaitensis]|uniref:hypothetical protein n=1 Tax=Glutamicibacter arilaitensis TaxID=256701 RepID=UPI003FD54428
MSKKRPLPIYLHDIVDAARAARDSAAGLSAFRGDMHTQRLRHWPEDVVKQWLYDHADHPAFLADYGHIDLTRVAWRLESVPLEMLVTMPTGASENDLIDYFAEKPGHWVKVRSQGCHVGVREMWELHGTWKSWPVLLDQGLIDPQLEGLQVVEGRTRVGVLRGRSRRGLHVAPKHLAWVGHPILG